MRPLVLWLVLFVSLIAADHSAYHKSTSSDADLGTTYQGGVRYVSPNLFTANKYAYALDSKDPFSLNGLLSLNRDASSAYFSGSGGSASDFSLDEKNCGLLTVTSKDARPFTFLCRESTYSFELRSTLARLTPSFFKQGYSQLVLALDDASHTLFVLNSNTPATLVQTVFRHFFDEGASTAIPTGCELSLSSDLKLLLLSCNLAQITRGAPGTAAQQSFTPVAESKGSILNNPGTLAREDPLSTTGGVKTAAAYPGGLRFESDVPAPSDLFPKKLFWAVPFAPDDEYQGSKVYDLCNAKLLDVNEDHGLKKKLLDWVRSVKDSNAPMIRGAGVEKQTPNGAKAAAGGKLSLVYSAEPALSFAPLKLPTIAEYVKAYFPNVVYSVATNPCGSDTDANGFFGTRIRKLNGQDVQACAHAGIDLRGKRLAGGAPIYNQPVKAMLPGKITRIKTPYQSGWKDYVVVVESGDWIVSYGHIRVVSTLKEGQTVAAGKVLGYPFHTPDASGVNREFQSAYGGELDVKVLYRGAEPSLSALTVGELKNNPNYRKFLTPSTRSVFAGPDFTFGVSDYDDYFLWEKYTGKEPVGASTPSDPVTSQPEPPSVPSNSKPVPLGEASESFEGTGAFSGKPLLCIFYSTDKKYEDLVFHLIRKDADGSETVVRQKRCTYSEDKTPGRAVACNEQNDAGFHTIFWDTRYAEYNPSRTREYLEPGKTYFLRMIGSFIQGNKKSVDQIGGHSYLQSAKGLYREDVNFGNLELSLKNKEVPIKVFIDGALVAFSAQDELSISIPVGKRRLKVCNFDAEIQVGSTPVRKEVDCKGFSYASSSDYSSDAAKAFVEEARTWIGTPYEWSTPKKGTAADCSGLVLGAYDNVRAKFKHTPLTGNFCGPDGTLPRTADMQYGCLRSSGNLVKSWNDVMPGDLIFQLNTYDGGGAGQPACTFQVASSGLTDTSNPACIMACGLQQAATRLPLTPDPRGQGTFCGVPTHVFIAADKPQLDANGKPLYIRAIEASGHGSFVSEIENRNIKGYNLVVGRIPWISSGKAGIGGSASQLQSGQCTDAALAHALSQYGLSIKTSGPDGKSTLRDLNDWKPKIQAYSKRHYGEDLWQLVPSVIVEHYTAASKFERELIDSTTRDGEAPGVASHFMVDRKDIYQILPVNVRSRGAFGVNHVALNIEMVAAEAGQLAQRPDTLDTAAKLTKVLMALCGIPLEKVYSHQQLNDGVRGVPEYKDNQYADYGDQRKSDPGEENMKTLKSKISALSPVKMDGTGSALKDSSNNLFNPNALVVFKTSDCAAAVTRACPDKKPTCALDNAAKLAGLDRRVNTGVAMAESGGNTKNYDITKPSSAGALGLMQLMPGTAREQGIPAGQELDNAWNACAGTRYLAYLLKETKTLECGLAAYNAGLGTVKGSNPATCVPNFPETKSYVSKVLKNIPVA